MQRKTTITILVCLGAITIAMTMLYWTSPISEDIQRSTFNRSFTNITVLPEAALELDEKNLYFAGADEENIYLGRTYIPYLLIKCSKDLKHSEKIILKMHGVDSVRNPEQFKITVDPPYFYLANGMMPVLLRGEIGKWTAEPLPAATDYYFTDVLPITTSTFAMRSHSTYQKGLQLAFFNELDTPYFKFNFNLLKQQQDGFFSVYGNILPYRKENKIVYVYTYRNQYLIIDSTLTSHEIKHTIDTFSMAPIRVGSYDQNSQHALSSPQNVVNGPSCISGDHLYIKSTLLAKNEGLDAFLGSSTIDVYDLKKGEYSSSFHIPNLRKGTLTDFRIIGDDIYAFTQDEVARFKISHN